jgi:hypothetical protein
LGKATAVAKMALASAASRAYLRMSSSFDQMKYGRRHKNIINFFNDFYDGAAVVPNSCPISGALQRPHQQC